MSSKFIKGFVKDQVWSTHTMIQPDSVFKTYAEWMVVLYCNKGLIRYFRRCDNRQYCNNRYFIIEVAKVTPTCKGYTLTEEQWLEIAAYCEDIIEARSR